MRAEHIVLRCFVDLGFLRSIRNTNKIKFGRVLTTIINVNHELFVSDMGILHVNDQMNEVPDLSFLLKTWKTTLVYCHGEI